MRRGMAKKFRSLSDAVKQLEVEGVHEKEEPSALFATCFYDQRFLKRLLWAERETPRRSYHPSRNMSVV